MAQDALEEAGGGQPPYLTTKEVAALLRVRERKVYDLAAAGGIPHRRITGKLLFPRTEILAWIEGGGDAASGVLADSRVHVVGDNHLATLVGPAASSGNCGENPAATVFALGAAPDL